jgi:hypothetical protein
MRVCIYLITTKTPEVYSALSWDAQSVACQQTPQASQHALTHADRRHPVQPLLRFVQRDFPVNCSSQAVLHSRLLQHGVGHRKMQVHLVLGLHDSLHSYANVTCCTVGKTDKSENEEA